MGADRLEVGARVRLVSSGLQATIAGFVGEGGQGAVYIVDLGSTRFALKWYHRHVIGLDVRLRERLARAIARGAPDGNFLWPVDLAEADEPGRFGYLMPVRASHLRSIHDIIAAPPKRISPSLVARATICLKLADSFLHLHAKGLCYQDINLGNIFVDPQTGDASICDNDNVDVNGAPGAVYGTRKFMAPEVVRREKLPDACTDLYSMAVLFFYALHSWHPLDGRAENAIPILDDEAEMRLYGTQPVFLFDPDDQSNGPEAGFHDPIVRRWRSLSNTVRALFRRSLGPGLADPSARVVETEWRSAMARLRDGIFACPHCGAEHALDAEDGDARPDVFVCVLCDRRIGPPARLVIGRDVIALTAGTRLFPHHLKEGRRFDFGGALASVESHPNDAEALGLRNGSGLPWACRLPDGRRITLDPNRAIRIVDGLEIDFGRRRGLVSADAAVLS